MATLTSRAWICIFFQWFTDAWNGSDVDSSFDKLLAAFVTIILYFIRILIHIHVILF
ncbi:unnamed protein product [Prunus brigantina]